MLPVVASFPSKQYLELCLEDNNIEAIARNLPFVGTLPTFPDTFECVYDETNLLCNITDDNLASLCKTLLPPDRMRLARTCKTLFHRICIRDLGLWRDVGSLAAFQYMCNLARKARISDAFFEKLYLAWPQQCLSMFNPLHFSAADALNDARRIRQDPTKLAPFIFEEKESDLEVWAVLFRRGLPPQSLDGFCETISTIYLGGRLSTHLPQVRVNDLLKKLRNDHPSFDFNAKLPRALINALDMLNFRNWRGGGMLI